ncbi:tyrosine-type recombinase/integrase [Candidatus Halobeggiatoa sp. HSG11]|nr:tyrosine-type recombinase/integrase [Candidatus Halobeggiatoa sp. HSG11]
MKNPNHPKKGSQIFVSPLTNKRLIKEIKKHLEDKPRDLCLFVMGINTALRASDLLRLKILDVQCLAVGDVLRVHEKKTKKLRNITVNRAVREVVDIWLDDYMKRDNYNESGWLFPSQRADHLTVMALNRMVKRWGGVAHVATGISQGNINYGSHTLRKTFAYHLRMSGVAIPILMEILNHKSQATTLRYLGIQSKEIADVYEGLNL